MLQQPGYNHHAFGLLQTKKKNSFQTTFPPQHFPMYSTFWTQCHKAPNRVSYGFTRTPMGKEGLSQALHKSMVKWPCHFISYPNHHFPCESKVTFYRLKMVNIMVNQHDNPKPGICLKINWRNQKYILEILFKE